MEQFLIQTKQVEAWIQAALDYVHQCTSAKHWRYDDSHPCVMLAWRYQNFTNAHMAHFLWYLTCEQYHDEQIALENKTRDAEGNFMTHDLINYPYNPSMSTSTGQTHQQFYAMVKRKVNSVDIDRGYYAGCIAKWTFIDSAPQHAIRVHKTILLHIEYPTLTATKPQ